MTMKDDCIKDDLGITYLRCPYCKTPMTCPSTTAYHLTEQCQTEEHRAKQKEYDDGIIHGMFCKMPMIEISKLVINPELRNRLTRQS